MNTFSSPPNVIREYNDSTYQLPLNSQFHQSPFLQTQSPDYVSLREEEDDNNDKNLDIMSSCIVDSVIYKSQKIAGPLLSQISNLNIQQALIIRELLFTLLGHEGHYIQYSKRYDPTSQISRIEGPDYKIAKNLDISLKVITKKLVKFGKFYSGLKSFIQVFDNNKFGKIVQKFCSEVRKFLSSYQQVLINVEHEFKFNKNFNLNMLDLLLHQEISNEMTHLYQIGIEISRITEERQKMSQAEIMGNFEPTTLANTSMNGINSEPNLYYGKFDCCKGGLLLQVIQERMVYYKGDPTSLDFLTQLFDIVSSDYIGMLNQWLLEGVINDPFDEFMIREKRMPDSFMEIFQSKSEYYWNELFLIKIDGLLNQFQNSTIQSKILNTGKYLNIFKRCTGLHNFESLKEKLTTITNLAAPDLELKIDEFYHRANKMLMKLLFDGYNFPSVVNIFQRLFLFADSFQIDNFIDSTFSELKRGKLKISVSRLQKQYDDIFKEKIENKVGVRPSVYDVLKKNQKLSVTSESLYKVVEELMEKNLDYLISDNNLRGIFHRVASLRDDLRLTILSTADSATENVKDEPTITSVDLTIPLPFPLNLVLNQQLSYQYEIMFKLLINIKFISKYNSSNWQEMNYSKIWTNSHFNSSVKKWILRCRVLHSRICSFIHELENYIVHDVIEHNFEEIKNLIHTTATNLATSELGSDINDEGDNIFNGSLIRGTFNNNSIFDSKVHKHRTTTYVEGISTVEQLIQKFLDYSSTLLNDSLLTREESLRQLRKMLDFIFHFNNYIVQVKKVLVLLNHELFNEYSKEFPTKFEKPMDQELIDKRFANLSDTFLMQYEKFGENLVTFLATIKQVGERENQGLLELSNRLELCFPE